MKKEKTDMKDENMLTKKDLNKCYIRLSLWGETSLNFERMQGIGFCNAMIPALKKLYTTKEDLSEALKRHLQFFNNAEERRIYKGVSANVDFYSGFVYSMLDLPLELYTPMFAVARIVGWSAHRMEELINADKIIRPAYKNVLEPAVYVPLNER